MEKEKAKTQAMNGAEAAKIVFRNLRSPSPIGKQKYKPLTEAILEATGDAKLNESSCQSLQQNVIIWRNITFHVGKITYVLCFEICTSSISGVLVNCKTDAWRAFGIAKDGSIFKEYIDNFFSTESHAKTHGACKTFERKFHALLCLHGGVRMNEHEDREDSYPAKAPIRRGTHEHPSHTNAVSRSRIPDPE